MSYPAKPYSAAYVQQHIRERILEEDCGHSSPCWIWQSAINGAGYPTGRPSGCKHGGMHRHSYEAFVGPIQSGLVIDHLCRVRACVNPDHLDAVTQSENVRRAAELFKGITWGGVGRRRKAPSDEGGGGRHRGHNIAQCGPIAPGHKSVNSR